MSEQSKHLQQEDISQSVQVLRYRGVFYIRQRSPNLRLTSAEVVNTNITQLHRSQRSSAMDVQRMGFLYKFYYMGWKNGSLKCFPLLQHWLLSIFLYYRRGYNEGSQWRQQHRLASLVTEMRLPSDRDF